MKLVESVFIIRLKMNLFGHQLPFEPESRSSGIAEHMHATPLNRAQSQDLYDPVDESICFDQSQLCVSASSVAHEEASNLLLHANDHNMDDLSDNRNVLQYDDLHNTINDEIFSSRVPCFDKRSTNC